MAAIVFRARLGGETWWDRAAHGGESSPMHQPHMVLVGAGHAHVFVLSQANRLAAAGARVTLVAPSKLWYSGLATGMLGGAYSPAQEIIDAATLARRRSVEFVCERVVQADPTHHTLRCDSGVTLSYDFLSVNIGSEVALDAIVGAREHACGVKPIGGLYDLRSRIESRFSNSNDPIRVTVVGGGAAGCEVAANLVALSERRRARIEVTIVTRAERLLTEWPRAAADTLAGALRARDIQLEFECEVTRIDQRQVEAAGGAKFRSDFVVVATGLRPPHVLREWGFALGEGGGLRVDEMLRSVGAAEVFAAGDCIEFGSRGLPKIGVFGVRQSPVLLHNLIASVRGRPLRRYRPQREFLSILNLGRGEALALRGRRHWLGRTSLWLKDRLDRRFMAKYQTPPSADGSDTDTAPVR